MIDLTDETEALLNELDSVLAEEIEMLDRRRTQLEQLSGLLKDRDYDRLESLLADVETLQQRQVRLDIRLTACRRSLARAIGWGDGELRLSDLAEELPQARAVSIDHKREQIILLASELRRKNLESAMLLQESARVNRMLLDYLFPRGKGLQTYGSGGTQLWRAAAGVVDSER